MDSMALTGSASVFSIWARTGWSCSVIRPVTNTSPAGHQQGSWRFSQTGTLTERSASGSALVPALDLGRDQWFRAQLSASVGIPPARELLLSVREPTQTDRG